MTIGTEPSFRLSRKIPQLTGLAARILHRRSKKPPVYNSRGFELIGVIRMNAISADYMHFAYLDVQLREYIL